MMEISESESGALPSTKPTSLTTDRCTQECLEGKPEHKHVQRPSKPGKYVCSYCGRACAKPSVLQKHIRSHTGERPYPCEPCGFSFKTKSNLYKHCKSHTHREKAGGSVERETTSISCSQEQLIELDEESQLASSSLLEKQKPIPKQCTTGKTSERLLEIIEDSQAVKKRLAMKLMGGRSRKASLLSFGSSRGSTESGYFSQSESFEVTPDSPNLTVATVFPEKIPEKSGCLCNVQLTARQYTTENKASRTLPPNKQVIDHITKLITINEAVVNTSKIDSVKPRRFSHHRQSRNDQKDGFSKDTILHTPKEYESSSKKLPVDGSPHKFHLQSVTMPQLSNLNPNASLETHPVSSDASEKAQLLGSQHHVQKRHHGMLRRQAAVEIPNDAETSDEQSQIYPTVPTTPESMPQEKEPLECFACGVHNWEMHGKHKKHICFTHKRQSKSPEKQSQGHKRVSSTHDDAFIFRKKRKEESLTLEDSLSSVPSLLPTGISTSFETSNNETSTQFSVSCLKEISVIHHTSSFEKLDGTPKAGGSEDASIGVGHSPYSESKHQAVTSSSHNIVRQHNVQMQGTVVANTKAMSVPSTSSVLQEKKMEQTCEFQWPQRSQSLSELPIEKLPPKKKRLRLSEAAQSSGDSSFESSFLPQSPIQGMHTSTRLTLFEERETDRDLPSNRSSRVVNYLTLSRNSHREMRRSASEKRSQVPQHVRLTLETRSKSFDLSRLSPERTASEWKRRSKGLTCRTMVDQLEEENELQKTFTSTYSTQRSIAPTSHSPSPTTFNRTPCLFNEKKIIQSFLIEDTPHKASKSCEKMIANLNCPSGAARANYSSGSAVLRLEIPTDDSDHQDHLLVDITLNPELLRPLPALTIPVRLNSCEPLHAGSIYTVSRIYLKTPVVSSPQEHGCSDVDVGPVAMTTRLITTRPDYQSEERIPVRAESNSSFLSCINSKESVSESKLQSQVKEDEEGDQEIERGSDILKLCKKDEAPLVLNDFKKPPVSAFTTDLVFSWCYLNNVKPRPSIQGKDGSSVYSSWATSTSNPYPCGLTSKEMLALLICRQKHGTPTYTMANTSSKPMVAEKGSMTQS